MVTTICRQGEEVDGMKCHRDPRGNQAGRDEGDLNFSTQEGNVENGGHSPLFDPRSSPPLHFATKRSR